MADMFEIKSCALSDFGRKRRNNEDFTAFYEPGDAITLQQFGCLYIVADGVGGASEGELASRYAAEQILREYYSHPEIGEPTLRLRQAFWQANQDIYAYAESKLTDMATTVVAALIIENQLIVANIGDSRAYLFHDGRAVQITTDHTVSGQMYRDGLLTEEEAFHFKGKNKLDRALGVDEEVRVDFLEPITLLPGDRILLCSDGLTKYALTNDITRMISAGLPDEIAQRLIDYSNRLGGEDNVSVILVEIGNPISPVRFATTTPHGRLPEEVDWDVIRTQATVLPEQRWWELPYPYQRYTVPVLLGAIVIIVITSFGIVFTIDQMFHGTALVSPTAPRQAPTTQAYIPPTEQDQPIGASQQFIPNETTYPSPIQYSPQATLLDAPTEMGLPQGTTTIGLTPSPDPSIDSRTIICGIQIIRDTVINDYLKMFHQIFNPETTYYQYVGCQERDDELICGSNNQHQVTIEDGNPIIFAGYWIGIPGVVLSQCQEKEGRIINIYPYP
jgi:PPM family protein phosphatase